jgi:hypothetical protein
MPRVKRLFFAAAAALVLVVPMGAAAAKTRTTTTSGAKTTTSKSKTATTRSTTTSSATVKLTPAATLVCRNKIINEWEGTGKIETTYPLVCYHSAITFVSGHADLTEYSSLGDDIRLALQAALNRSHGETVPLKVGKHYGKNVPTKGTGTSSIGPGKTPTTGETTPTVAVADTGSSSSSTPLPILILGGLAIVLIAAGAIGAGVRYQRRRNGGPPAAA